MAMEPAAELWHEWAEGRLCFQECDACQAIQHPPGPVCGTCHSTSLHLAPSDGHAALVSWSTVHRAPAPAFAADVPYTIGLVSLRGGALVQARVLPGMSPEGWAPGLPATLRLGEVAGRPQPVIDSVGG
ncbi:MAG: OB-fold domain-containing protein [Actinomycetota bacterium]|nr:OB-fold domain-containing protein [Actinomycetota bacterium]